MSSGPVSLKQIFSGLGWGWATAGTVDSSLDTSTRSQESGTVDCGTSEWDGRVGRDNPRHDRCLRGLGLSGIPAGASIQNQREAGLRGIVGR